jgi:hypothetical protein
MSATKMLRAAQEIDFNSIKNITQTTIWSIYPKYYPRCVFTGKTDVHKRNYVVKKYDMIETENGDYLCYDTMEKFL